MVVTTENRILHEYKSRMSSKGSVKNTLVQKIPTSAGLTSNLSTKNALLERLTKVTSPETSETRSKHIEKNLPSKSKTLFSEPRAIENPILKSRSIIQSPDFAAKRDKFAKKSYIPNPMLGSHTKEDFSSLTRNNLLLSSTAKPVLSTTNTLLAPTFSLKKPSSARPAVIITHGSLETALPSAYTVNPLSREDIKEVSACIGEADVKFPSPNVMKQTTKIERSKLDIAKAELISVTCTALINNPVWFNDKDSTRSTLCELSAKIAKSDPEFVLKVALYTRSELNIRTTCNFLVAVASFLPACRPFLKKYFEKTIVLPSDWIQIAEFYQSLQNPDGDKDKHTLPAALRKILVAKFPKFDEYQLAKYNKDKSKNDKKKEKNKEKKENKDENEKTTENDMEVIKSSPSKLYVPSYTLKYLIRKLHIVKPAYPVMCVLGKKYPSTVEEFYKHGLEGTWDSALSGKRMKLEVPETWETQVSAKGNIAKTWQDLLDHRKLPFMAMLRNLRNMIKAGISEKHHQQVLKTLTNEKAVSRSRQFPFRFFSAYEILDELEKELEKQGMYKKYGLRYFLTRQERYHTERKFGDPKPKTKEAKQMDHVKRIIAKKYGEPFRYDAEILKRYRNALNEAVKIATANNVSPIPGHTVVLCDASRSMSKKCMTSKGLGSSRTIGEVGILLGLMCAYSCEACTFVIFNGKQFECVELEKGGILENLKRIMTFVNFSFGSSSKCLPESFLRRLVMDKIKMDNFLILSSTLNENEEMTLRYFLQHYKCDVNSSLLCYKVDLRGKRSSVENEPGVVNFSGFSEQILKFIALGNAEAQMKHVETIDMRLNLAALRDNHFIEDIPPVMAEPAVPWKTVRVFISSTIKDMTNERDALVSRVLPLLREKAKELKMHVVETDLRWGITGEDTRHGRNVSICLREVEKCSIFIGILGDRYGWIPQNYGFSDETSKWLEDYPKGRSITELEIMQGAFQNRDYGRHCLFYFRDSSEIKPHLPNSLRDVYFERNSKKLSKLKRLKTRILNSEHYVGEVYTPAYDDIRNGVVTLTGLTQFENMIAEDLWKKVVEISKTGSDSGNDSDVHHDFAFQQDFVGRNSFMSSILRKINLTDNSNENLVFAIVGCTGSGKTSVLTNLYRCLLNVNMTNINFIHLARPEFENAHSPSNLFGRLCFKIAKACQFSDFNLQNKAHTFSILKNLFETLREKYARPPSVYILIDDVDNFESLTWVLKLVGLKATLIVTCKEGGNSHKALKHMDRVTFIHIPELTITDKREIVCSALGKHSKKLEESSFNNQLQILMSKKQSTNPMYLANICDAIRVDETFESLGETLRNIPHDMVGALKWQLGRIEARFSKYHGLVAAIFGILHCSSQWKIAEDELCEVIQCWFAGDGTDDYSRAVILNVINSLRSFLSWSQGQSGRVLTLRQSVHQKVLQEKYFGKADFLESCHSALAGFYSERIRNYCIQTDKDIFMLTDSFMRLPTHLVKAGQRLSMIDICGIDFVALKCKLGLGKTLLEDFQLLHEHGKSLKHGKIVHPPKQWEELEKYVKSSIGIINSYPNMVYQQALNSGGYSRNAVVDGHHCLSTMVSMERGSCDDNLAVQTFHNTVAQDPSTCLAVCSARQIFSAGTLSGKVKIVQKSTGKEIYHVGHCSSVTALSFIKSTLLVSGAGDGTMIAWDVMAGHKIANLKVHQNKITAIVVRPANQGESRQVFVSASIDRTLAIWTVTKWQMVERVSTGSPVNCLDFHPSEAKIAAGLWDASIQIWDVHTYKRIAVIRGHLRAVSSLQFSMCGTYIASCSKYETVVRLWTTNSGTPLGNFSETYLLSPEAVTFASNGKYLLGGGAGTNEDSAEIAVWKSRLGKEETCYHTGDKEEFGNASCCKYDFSGSSFAVGFHEGFLSIFDCRLPDPVYSEKIFNSAITCVAWGPTKYQVIGENFLASMFICEDEHLDQPEVLITGGHDHTLKAIDLNSKAVIAVFEGHTAPVLSCDCSKKWLASGGEDFSVLLWKIEDIHSPDIQQEMLSNANIGNGTISQQNQADNSVNAFNVKNPVKTVLHSKSARGHEGAVSCVEFNTSGSILMSGGRDGNICYWNVSSNTPNTQQQTNRDLTPILTVHQAHKDWITCCAWNSHSDTVVTGSNDSTLKIWQSPSVGLKKDKCVTPLYSLTGHASGVTSVVYKLGCVVSTGGEDRTIKVWSHKGIEITSLNSDSRVNCCDVKFPDDETSGNDSDDSSDENSDDDWADQVEAEEWLQEHAKRKPGAKNKNTVVSQMQNFDVLCASNGASVVLWKPLAGQKVSIFNEQAKSISAMQVYDERQVLSQSSNGTIKAWDIANASNTVRQKGKVTGISTLRDGLVTTCSAGYVYLWTVYRNSLTLQYQAKMHQKEITGLSKLEANVFATSSHDRNLIIWSVESFTAAEGDNEVRKIAVIDTVKCAHPLHTIALGECVPGAYKILVEGVFPCCTNIVVKNGRGSVSERSIQIESGDDATFYLTKHERIVRAFRVDKTAGILVTDKGSVIGGDDVTLEHDDLITCATHSNSFGSKNFLLLGSTTGILYSTWDGSRIKVHDSKVTAILDTGRYFVTTSLDSMVKVWEKRSWKQVGQYFNSSPITAAYVINEKLLAFGDSSGVVDTLVLHC